MNRVSTIVLAVVLLVAGLLLGFGFLGDDEAAPALPPQATPVAQADVPGATEPGPVDQAPSEGLPELESPTVEDAKREAIETSLNENVVRGRVVDELGGAVESFTLVGDHRGKKIGSERTERELGPFTGGVFELEDLEEGRWRLKAIADNHQGAKRLSFSIPHDDEELLYTLTRQSIVTGQVLDPEGMPAATATVVYQEKGSTKRAETDEQGRFRFNLLPGSFECLAQDELFAAGAVTKRTIEAGATLELELHLRLGAELIGKVLDAEDRPRGKWWIQLNSTLWTQDRREVQADERGEFRLAHVAPGTYWVEAKAEQGGSSGGKPVRDAVDLVAGETTELVLGGLNEEAITLRGTVFMHGKPAPGQRVWGNLEGKESFSSGSTVLANEQGRYELEFPGPGRASILVSPRSGQIIPLSHELTEEREQDFDVVVPEGRISGRVTKVGEPSKKRRSVVCTAEGLNPVLSLYLTRNIRCEKDGSFSIDYLPAGSYRLAVSGVMHPRSVIDDIQLTPDGSVEGLVLEVGDVGKAEVLVVDSEGQPVSDALVYAQDSAGFVYTPGLNAGTSADGKQAFSKLGLGEFRFFSRKDGLASPLSDVVQIDSEKAAEITVQLEEGARGVIQVMDAGVAVSAKLWIIDEDGNDYSRTLETFDHSEYLTQGSDSAKYELGPLPPGRYQVRARSFEGRSGSGEIELVRGRVESLEVKLGD